MSNKPLKVILVVSLLLNATLVAGLIFYKIHTTATMNDIVIQIAKSENQLFKKILADIKSDDRVKIEAVKQQLQIFIENGEANITLMKKAGQK